MKVSWFSKAWSWLKENWQWILFPVGAIFLLSSYFSNLRSIEPTGLDHNKIDKSKRREEMEIAQSEALRDAKLKELADAHQDRLSQLSASQERELEDLAEKPIEEVVSWFDKL